MSLDVQGAADSRACFRGRVSRRLATSLASLLLFAPLALYAQSQPTSAPENEYKKLIKVNEDIQPLGDTPFGEQISLYDGSLSFQQTDISVSGRGPTITIGRVFRLRSADERIDFEKRAFGDWDIDIPMITTLTPVKSGIRVGWLVAASNKKAICSSFREPPSVAGINGNADWEVASWWSGYQMHIPGQGSQELLMRTPGNTAQPSGTYPIVTKQNWTMSCVAESRDATTQGFLAMAPDGTKYTFNRLTYRSTPGVSRPAGSPPGFAARGSSTMALMAAGEDLLNREEGRMLVTRIEDRFGNGINYTYDAADHLTNIDSDGDDNRHVTLAYNGDRVTSITVQGGAAGNRVWQYGYTANGLITQLSTVTQPDQSSWGFNLTNFNNAYADMGLSPSSCDQLGTPENINTSYTGYMTHPSGLSSSFTVKPLRRGRSYVVRACRAAPGAPSTPTAAGTYAYTPNAFHSMAITQKQFSGAGIGTQTWQYTYSPSNESWSINCGGGCASTVWTKVLYPDNHAERSTFSNKYDWSESLLMSDEVFAGDADVSRRKKVAQYSYVDPTPGNDGRAAAYPSPWGYTVASRMNDAQMQNQIPMGQQVVTIDDDQNPLDPRGNDQFLWKALNFDAFARPNDVQRCNNFSSGMPGCGGVSGFYGMQERNVYQDDYAHWVLGLPLQTTNVSTGDVVSRNVYNASNLTLSERYQFGRKVMGYTFDGQGQLASFTDGNNQTTGLGSYKRGIPRTISYPDGKTQGITVDDLGQITAITNQAGAVTSYGYDAIGRLARIDYPAGDAVAWAPKTFAYSYNAAARGVNGPHWVRVVSQGNKFQRTDYDAMLRPVMSGSARASDQAFYVSARTDYDWKGRKTFASYPVDGYIDLPNIGAGVSTGYDVLGRVINSVQTSELGNLTTTTAYFAGGARRVTDPKGIATTSWFQAFDQPSFESPLKIVAPEGVTQVIDRDLYGNPHSIQQGGLTKWMYYDSEKRLCRTAEPESGSEVMAYDGAGNLAWSVSGATISGDACGQEQVVENAKTVRAYDGMNRVTSIVYPTGTQPSTFTYDPLGNPATATSGTASWTFGRNKLGLLTAEVLAIDGWGWSLGYGYDPNGALSTVLYPDGEIVAYNPDAMGRPTTAGGYVGGVNYFPDGDIKSYSLGNGGLYTADKNARNLLKTFTYGKNSVPAVSEDFAYDANGNVSSIADLATNGQRSKTMTYDNLNRLLSATATNLWGTESYTYDTLNNIRTLSSGGTTNTYNYDARNLLTSITSGTTQLHGFDYDPRGNTTLKDGQALNFDMANRLVSMPTKGAYTYDAAGRRVKKVTGAATTYYAYNSAGQLMWEYDNATTNGTNYVYLGKKLVANAKAPTSKVIGNFDGLFFDGTTAYVRGWACSTGLPASIDVHVYAGDTAASATFVRAGTANVTSEPAIQTLCHTSGTAYRFSVEVTEADRAARVEQGIWIYGISPVGNNNNMLTNSGNVYVPAATAAPSSPAPASVSKSADQSTLTVSWVASTNVTSYAVDRSYNGAAFAPIWTGTATSVAATGAVDGTYVFRVRACNATACAVRVKTPLVTVAHIPPAPASISVPGTSSGSVAISWPAATWATSYQVEHTTDGNWSNIYTGTATSYTRAETVTSNWYYRVRGCNVNGCGPYATSGYVTVTIPPASAPSIAGGGANHNGAWTISWSGVAGATYYNLFESTNGGGWGLVAQGGINSWSTSGRPNASYAYAVQACNAGGCSAWSGQTVVTVTLPPVAPGRPSISQTGTTQKPVVWVRWSATTYATRYEVVETLPSGYSETVYGGSDTVWSSLKLFTGTLTYKVRACNDVACSAYSPTSTINLHSGD